MYWRRGVLALAMVASALCGQTYASQFVVFPKAGELVSPDGRFSVRNAEREAPASELDGTFHSLWLIELASGRSRKLCNYVGVAAVAWSAHDALIVTEYVGKRTSRALVFSVTTAADPVMLDKAALTQLVPIDLRPALRGNDHIFVEGSRIEGDTLHLHVWGYGAHDADGFRWRCEYALSEGTIACEPERGRASAE